MSRTHVAAALLAAVLGGSARSADPPDDPPGAGSTDQAWLMAMKEAVAGYAVYRGAGRDDELKLQPDPVLLWSNPARRSKDGGLDRDNGTFVWTWQGRPAVLVDIYEWRGDAYHAFQSLDSGPVSVERDGEPVWAPEEAGVEFRPVPGAETPSPSQAQRQREAKLLAREFRAKLLGWSGESREHEELRMLPQPLFRYSGSGSESFDGAVFAFVQGTDPEAVLLIEAFEGPAGWEWRYGVARRTTASVELYHGDRKIWSVEPLRPEDESRRSPSFTRFIGPVE